MPIRNSESAPSATVMRRAGPSPLVLVVYHCIAHYRGPVFKALIVEGDRRGLRYEFVSDSVADIPSIRVLDPANLSTGGDARWTAVRNRWLPKNFLWQHGLLPAIWRKRPDATIFLGDFHFVTTWIGAVVLRCRRAHVLMWTHGFKRRQRGVIGGARLLFYRLASHLLVYGNRAREILIEKGYQAERIDVVYNSLNYGQQLAVRRTLQRRSLREVRLESFGDSEARVLVYSGRLERTKELGLLLRALATVRAVAPDVRLVCIGDGPEREELEAQAQAFGVSPAVEFMGACYDEDVLGRVFFGAELAVSPGPIGLLAVHALVYGTPVILHDGFDRHGPEFEAVVAGSTGMLFAEGSAEDLAAKILAALATFSKPDVSERCFRAVDEFYTPENQARIITDSVCRLLRGNSEP